VVATEAHWAGVYPGLKAQNLDVDRAIEKRLLIALEVESPSTSKLDEMHEPARFLNRAYAPIDAAAKASRRDQLPRVAVCRECPPQLLAEGKIAEVLRLEQLWALLDEVSGLDVLCGYALATFEKRKDIFQAISAVHSS
jgi:hypothetical protein